MVTNISETRVNAIILSLGVLFMIVLFLLNSGLILAVDPMPPDTMNATSNETKTNATSKMINVSGGRVVTLNLTVDTQNTRWKAFLGEIVGTLNLVDAAGAKIYKWTFTQTTGRVYATRNSSNPVWSIINCSNLTQLQAEDVALEHTSSNDNISVTFNTTAGATHQTFTVGSRTIVNDTCPTLSTYVNNVSQDTDFEEVALWDNSSIIYTALVENNTIGYDSIAHDFQMIVPENGNITLSVSTAYYIYLELD